MSTTNTTLPFTLQRVRGLAMIIAPLGLLAGLGLSIPLATELDSVFDKFMQAYVYGFWLWFAIPMGSFAFIMIHHMTTGAWSYVSQRIFEAAMRTLPLMLVLFIPILIGPFTGLHSIYSGWTAATETLPEIVQNKLPYLNPPFWTGRALAYFAAWIAISMAFNGWSKKLDETGDALIVKKFRFFAPLCLIFYCLSMTLAATDWIISIEAEWWSTMYAPLTWISQGLTTLSFTVIILSYMGDDKPLSNYLSIEHYHHLGNLMLGFTVLWAYMSFSQYLIIWSANLPEEIHYYLNRQANDLNILSVILMGFHFLAPLLILLFRRNKRSASRLRTIAFYVLGMRMLDVFWHINPSFHHPAPGIYWNEVLTHLLVFAGIGGVWMWFFLGELTKRPMLCLNDPHLHIALGHRDLGHHEEASGHA